MKLKIKAIVNSRSDDQFRVCLNGCNECEHCDMCHSDGEQVIINESIEKLLEVSDDALIRCLVLLRTGSCNIYDERLIKKSFLSNWKIKKLKKNKS